MQYINVANQGVKSLSPYQAGKPIEELERELGITNIVKLASNENPFGFPESAKKAIQAQLDHLTRVRVLRWVFRLGKVKEILRLDWQR